MMPLNWPDTLGQCLGTVQRGFFITSSELNGDFVGLQRLEPPLLRRARLTIMMGSSLPIPDPTTGLLTHPLTQSTWPLGLGGKKAKWLSTRAKCQRPYSCGISRKDWRWVACGWSWLLGEGGSTKLRNEVNIY